MRNVGKKDKWGVSVSNEAHLEDNHGYCVEYYDEEENVPVELKFVVRMNEPLVYIALLNLLPIGSFQVIAK